MKFDLHIHSCLSPCGSLEMSPSEIVKRAIAAGLDGIALTDHQSAKNAPAVIAAAQRLFPEFVVLPGVEVQTSEEVHTLALFDSVEKALELTEWIYAALPRRKNDPDTFGDQPVVSEDDEIVELEERLLASGCARTIPEVAEFVHAREGLYIAAHIDRPHFSIFGSLGEIPEPFDRSARRYFDALELSRTADEEVWRERIGDYALIRSSDAHYLGDVARVWTEAEGPFSFESLREALRSRATRISPRINCFT